MEIKWNMQNSDLKVQKKKPPKKPFERGAFIEWSSDAFYPTKKDSKAIEVGGNQTSVEGRETPRTGVDKMIQKQKNQATKCMPRTLNNQFLMDVL